MGADFKGIHGLDEGGAVVALHDGLRLARLEALGRRLLHRRALHHTVLHPVHPIHHRAAAAAALMLRRTQHCTSRVCRSQKSDAHQLHSSRKMAQENTCDIGKLSKSHISMLEDLKVLKQHRCFYFRTKRKSAGKRLDCMTQCN